MSAPATAPRRPRNDPAQYDDLADQWWDPTGAFAALHWLAVARGALIPPAPAGGEAKLVDLGCGAGLLAPHVPPGYMHIGVDINAAALEQASARGVRTIQADATRVPLPDAVADVVVAGELLEHVPDPEAVVAEMARLVRPGGTVVFDTIADTRWARLSLVTVGERMPGGPPPRIHDPALFVSPERLRSAFAAHGIPVTMRGLQPHSVDYLRFLFDRSRPVRMIPTRSLAALYQGSGVKR